MSALDFKDIKNGRFYNEDCFDAMREIPDGVIDMVLADLPYGTTACAWDTILPFEKLWQEYWRVSKDNAAIILTASQPFTTALIYSQIDHFKYEWIWDKVNRITGALQSNKRPMKRHENVCVFYKKQPTYNKQHIMKPRIVGGRKHQHGEHVSNQTRIDTEYQRPTTEDVPHNPNSIIHIEGFTNISLHPTQKPVPLFEYFIKTYTNENEIVLDNTAGSGTTAIAAINTNRKWVCIEKEQEYYYKAIERIENHGVKKVEWAVA